MDVEKAVGIVNYSTDNPGLCGVIKERTADFIVREILPDGTPLVTRTNRDLRVPPHIRDTSYTHFNLVKFNKDTILAIREIAEKIGREVSDFSYAGIKDNRAITVQRVACRGNIGNALKNLQLKNIEINDIYFDMHSLQIGELWGNNFSIIIRNIKRSLEETKAITERCLQQIQERGFPNYYGIQRFGMHRPNSHAVGRLILLQKFEDAIKMMLFERFDMESQVARDFRTRLEASEDFSWALENIPEGMAYEKILVNYLLHHPRDYKGAFCQLPLSLQSLILSSFQSYLFNCHLNFRFALTGRLDQLYEGDRVTILDEYHGLPTRTLIDVTRDNFPIIQKAINLHHAAPALPLIGYDTNLATWLEGDKIGQFIEKLGVSPENFRLTELPKLKNYRGSYRPILVKPKDFELVQAGPDEYHAGSHSIEIQFSLPRGTYATCLLRELNKAPEEIRGEETSPLDYNE